MMQLPYHLRAQAGEEEAQAGEKLYRSGAVRVLSQSAKQIRCAVSDDGRHEVLFMPSEPAQCTCETWRSQGACRHVAAALLCAQESGALEELMRLQAAASAPKLMAAMESALPEVTSLKMEVNLMVEPLRVGEKPRMKIGLRMGEERLYVVRSIPQLMEAMDSGEAIDYGKGFTFHPEWMQFSPVDKRIIAILRAMCMAQKETGATMKIPDQRVMALPEPFAEAILEELMHMPFRLTVDGKAVVVKRVRQARIPLQFRVASELRGLTISAVFPRDFRPLTASCSYAVAGGAVVHVDEDQRSVLRVLWAEQFAGRCRFDYPVREADRVIGELVPFLKLTGVVEISENLQKQLIRLPLVARVYLDRAGKDVVARAQFRYGDKEIDPFDETPAPEAIRRGEIEAWELEGARRTVMTSYMSALDSQARQEDFWLGQAAAGVDEGLEELARRIEQVTCEQVVEAAHKLQLDTIYFLKGKEA